MFMLNVHNMGELHILKQNVNPIQKVEKLVYGLLVVHLIEVVQEPLINVKFHKLMLVVNNYQNLNVRKVVHVIGTTQFFVIMVIAIIVVQNNLQKIQLKLLQSQLIKLQLIQVKNHLQKL